MNGIDVQVFVCVNLLTKTNFEAYTGYVDRSTGWLALYSVDLLQTQNKYEHNSLSCKFKSNYRAAWNAVAG